MKNSAHIICLLLVTVVVVACRDKSESPVTLVNLSGHISDSVTHRSLRGATVQLVNAGANAGKWAITDDAGDYILPVVSQQEELMVSGFHTFYHPATKTFTLTSTQSRQRLDFELVSRPVY